MGSITMKSLLLSAMLLLGISYSEYTPAQNQYTPAGEIVSSTCTGTTLKLRIANGVGGLTKEDTDNSVECGGTGGLPGPGGGDTGGDNGGGDNGGGDNGGGNPPPPGDYCENINPALIDCDPAVNLDPWVASTGEKPYWIRNGRILSLPFTFYIDQSTDYYQYFQFTSPESQNKGVIFKAWFSLTPGGVLLDNDPKCEWLTRQARGSQYLSPLASLASQVCYTDPAYEGAVMYYNFAIYDNIDTGAISSKTYQFDAARRAKTVNNTTNF